MSYHNEPVDERLGQDIRTKVQLSSDTDLLNWLQLKLDQQTYTGKCIFRWSTTGRGWRLHETSDKNASKSVRTAIQEAIIDEEQEGIFL